MLSYFRNLTTTVDHPHDKALLTPDGDIITTVTLQDGVGFTLQDLTCSINFGDGTSDEAFTVTFTPGHQKNISHTYQKCKCNFIYL